MPGAFLDDDLEDCFFRDASEFNTLVSWRIQHSGSTSEFYAVFDSAHVALEVEANVRVETVTPILTAKTADIPTIARHGDVATIAGVEYVVTGLQPDGTGVTVVALEKRNP